MIGVRNPLCWGLHIEQEHWNCWKESKKNSALKMKIKIEIEVDTEIEQDLNTVEEIIYKLKDLLETQGDDEDA